MTFDDYGIVSWYNGEYGVILTPSRKQIFIHTKNKVSNGISKDDFALIGNVNFNTKRNREEGANITGFNKSENDKFVEIILQNWKRKKVIEFDDHIYWILQHGNNSIFQQILDIDQEYWLNSNEFNSWVINHINKYKPISHEYIFRLWLHSTDSTALLFAIFKNNDISLIEQILNTKFNIVHETIFDRLFYLLTTDNQEYIIKCVTENINNVSEILFVRDLEWIFKYSKGKQLDQVINAHFNYMVNSDTIIKYLLNKRRIYFSIKVNDLVYQNYLKLGKSEYNSHVKFLILHESHDILLEIVNSDINYWFNSFEFIKDIKENYSYEKPTEKIIVNQLKYDYYNNAIEDSIFYEFQSESQIKTIIWLVKNTDLSYFISELGNILINDLRSINLIITNGYILNLIREEEFLFQAWNNLEPGSCPELEIWILKNSKIDIVIDLLSRKYNYKRELVQNWYNAFFPNTDTLHYEKWVATKDWSHDFQVNYIYDKLENIRTRFLTLFIRQKNVLEIKPNLRTVHSATDLATYQFCPASYIVNATHTLSSLENDLMFIGREEHEKVRLLQVKNRKQLKEKYEAYGDNNEYRDLIRLILRSECIYEGHKDDKQDAKIFYSKKKNISMCPDYIFKDKDSVFVVEEKYTFNKFENVTGLYLNHRVQALAYLYGLSQLNVSTAYVVYWFYNLKDKAVNQVRVFKLSKNQTNLSILVGIFNTVEALNNGKIVQLSPSDININKCIKCQAFAYCIYKTGEIQNIGLQ